MARGSGACESLPPWDTGHGHIPAAQILLQGTNPPQFSQLGFLRVGIEGLKWKEKSVCQSTRYGANFRDRGNLSIQALS